MPVEKLISLTSIRNELSWIIYEGHVTRALRSPWERDRYHTIVASDSKTWIAAKKTTMTLEDRVRFIDGLRGVKDAIKVTAESLAAGPEFRDAEYLIWIPFTGNRVEVHRCVDEGFRPIRNTGRVTFYLDGAERFRRGGAMAMEDADYLFCMDIRILFQAGFEMWLDPEDKAAGEMYTRCLRVFHLACQSVYDCRGREAHEVWRSPAGQTWLVQAVPGTEGLHGEADLAS